MEFCLQNIFKTKLFHYYPNKNFDFSGEYTSSGIWCIGNYGNCYLVVPISIPYFDKDEYSVTVTELNIGSLEASIAVTADFATVKNGFVLITASSALDTIRNSVYARLGTCKFVLTKVSD